MTFFSSGNVAIGLVEEVKLKVQKLEHILNSELGISSSTLRIKKKRKKEKEYLI